ncbi:hypothetical protein NQ314_007371 [Rhamnusium bicolor]|uniref:Uncharacterized protein n=1 Tax=Rhamnusium bicolor TaxID=1586634 RepID=A0AAV8YNQ0_9CUCU|nr:hypothetical protein NQ314_007371 [Rhamnusium bicolor]
MPKCAKRNRFQKKVLTYGRISQLLIDDEVQNKEINSEAPSKISQQDLKNSLVGFVENRTSMTTISTPNNNNRFDVHNPIICVLGENVNTPCNTQTETKTESIEMMHSCEGSNNHSLDLPFREKLTSWAVNENISQSSLNKLLEILKTEKDTSSFKNLPKDSRTLLQTPKKVDIVKLGSGFYYYFGISNSINRLIASNNCKLSDDTCFELAVNIDGLPISNSSSSCLWPILAQVKSVDALKSDIIVVALFSGNSKPEDSNEFLKEFVNESVVLTNNGIFVNNKHYKFKISMLICDVPAKSFLLCVKGHNAYFSCTKCKAEGDFINNVICFPEYENFRKRSDAEFRQQVDDEYHMGVTILTKLPNFDMIKNVPLDYMHLLCLGVMKRLLVNKNYGWIFGRQSYKLPYSDINKLSDLLTSLSKFIPSEFSRKTRLIEECKRYKATEFRLLLLYVGPVVFKKSLNPQFYDNFLSLHIACLIMCSGEYHKDPDMLNYANELMKFFVKKTSEIYGYDFISHNVHNLLHLSDDIFRYGKLDDFSAFPFENYMSQLKKMLRKSEKPLQQIVNRISEGSFVKKVSSNSKLSVQLLQQHFEGPLLQNSNSVTQYKVIKSEKYVLKTNEPDCFVQLQNNDIIRVVNFTRCNNGTSSEIRVIGYKFWKKTIFLILHVNLHSWEYLK